MNADDEDNEPPPLGTSRHPPLDVNAPGTSRTGALVMGVSTSCFEIERKTYVAAFLKAVEVLAFFAGGS